MKKFLLYFLIFLFATNLYSKDKLNKKIDVSVWGQIWSPYSMDASFAQENSEGVSELSPVDDRYNVYLRRARVFLKSSPLDNLKFTLQLYYDNLGKDNFSSMRGGFSDAEFGIWDAFLQWGVDSEYFNVLVGYFRPQVGREGITSATQVISFEKAITQNYQRQHSIGRGNGRETGINIGGLKLWDNFGINYNVGLFDASHSSLIGANGGSPNNTYIYAGRVVFMIGDPEMTNYKIGYKMNYFGERRGLSIAANGTYSENSNIFDQNTFVGGDILFNWDWISLDAEFNVLSRTVGETDYTDFVWHVRGGYTFKVSNFFLEPAFLYNRFEGDEQSVRYPNGIDELIDLGLNLYLFKNNLKVSGHYIMQNGDAVSKKTDGENFELGNVIALGCQFSF